MCWEMLYIFFTLHPSYMLYQMDFRQGLVDICVRGCRTMKIGKSLMRATPEVFLALSL